MIVHKAWTKALAGLILTALGATAFGLEILWTGSQTEDDGRDHTREPAFVALLRSQQMFEHSSCCSGAVGVSEITHEYRCTPQEINVLLRAFAELRGSHDAVELWPDTDDDGNNYVTFHQLRDYWPGGFDPEYLREQPEIPPPDRDKHVNNLKIAMSRAASVELLEMPENLTFIHATDAVAARIIDFAEFSNHQKLRAMKSMRHLVRLPNGAVELLETEAESEDEELRKAAQRVLSTVQQRSTEEPEMIAVDVAIEELLQ